MHIETIKRELQARTRGDLIKLASELKIPGRHKKKKQELIKEIAIIKKRAVKRPESPRPEAGFSLPELTTEPDHFPDSYDETRVVLLPVDPYLVHVYWSIASRDLERVRNQIGEEVQRAQATLRFYDITCIFFDGTNAHSSFDMDIDLHAWNWYVHLWSPEKSYCVDIGLKTEDGRFLPIARSNVAETPPAHPSERGEEKYMRVAKDYKRVEIVSPVPAAERQYGLVPGAKKHIGVVSPAQLPLHPSPIKEESSYKGHNEPLQMDMDKALQGKLAELYRFRLAEFPRPSSKSVQDIHSPSEEADLTEMNERGLTTGISSKVVIPEKRRIGA